MSIGVNSQITNINNIQPKAQVSFRAQTTPVKDYPPDTVEISGKKKDYLLVLNGVLPWEF